MMAACRYTRLKVHGKVHKYYGTSPIVFGSDGVDTVCNKGAVHKKASLRNEVSGTNVKIKVNVQIFCARAQKSKHV